MSCLPYIGSQTGPFTGRHIWRGEYRYSKSIQQISILSDTNSMLIVPVWIGYNDWKKYRWDCWRDLK